MNGTLRSDDDDDDGDDDNTMMMVTVMMTMLIMMMVMMLRITEQQQQHHQRPDDREANDDLDGDPGDDDRDDVGHDGLGAMEAKRWSHRARAGRLTHLLVLSTTCTPHTFAG